VVEGVKDMVCVLLNQHVMILVHSSWNCWKSLPYLAYMSFFIKRAYLTGGFKAGAFR
jgi:hypothetical protein